MRIQSALILSAFGIFALSQFAAAGDVTLAWDANTEPELLGYYLCYGTSSGTYTKQVDVGNVTTRTVSGLSAGTYYFAVKAYGIEGLESAYSNEVSATVTENIDQQAPIISNVASSGVTTTGATIAWTTNEAADTQVDYGLTSGYGSSTTLNSALSTSHSQSLSGLNSGTTYHYRVRSRDASGNLATSGDYSFTTAIPQDNTPPTISNVASSGVTTTGATIAWTTNEAADTQVDYGLTSGYGSSTTLNSALSTSHSQSLSGLNSGTTYHYRVRSRDASGNLATSGDYSFTTTAASDKNPPNIRNVKSSRVTSMSAKITWTTDEPANSDIDYGTTTSYTLPNVAVISAKLTARSLKASGSAPVADENSYAASEESEYEVAAASGASRRISSGTVLVTNHSITLNGLSAGTTYHYRVKSMDAAGNQAVSADYTFSTPTKSDIVTGLAAAYTFDEGSGLESADLSGNGNTAVIHSAVWTGGRYGKALSFNGVDSYVSAGTAGLPGVNEPKTISCWVNLSSGDSTARTMLTLANAQLRASLQHGYRNSEAGVLDFENNWAVVARGPSPGKWHHFGYVFDGTRSFLYIDGSLASTSTIQSAAAPVTDFEIGRWIDGSEYFEGAIDDVRIYTRALTEEELRLAMNTPVAGPGATAAAQPDPETLVRTAADEAAAQPAVKPVVDVQLERQAYKQGETVTASAFWISNPSTEDRKVELKSWIELPGMPPISLGNPGVGENLSLAAGFNRNYGAKSLLQISDESPAGTCRIGARLVDPTTGGTLSLDTHLFRINGTLSLDTHLFGINGVKSNPSPADSIPDLVLEGQYRIINRGAFAAGIEVKMWSESADGTTAPALSAGPLVLPPGADITFVPPTSAEGRVLKVRILDAATGEILLEK